jgi:tRNA A-37 threonylcarbamoyl transferase component Bud32
MLVQYPYSMTIETQDKAIATPHASASCPPREARRLYRTHLRPAARTERWNGSVVCGIWKPDPAVSSAALARQVETVIESGRLRSLKKGNRITVRQGSLLGEDAVLKEYRLQTPVDTLKYALRHSRARRYWAAARTMEELGIPTPEPLGYLEYIRHGIPVCSYVFTRFIADSVPSRKWIEPRFADQPPERRKALREELLEALLTLYRHGIYHRDTKLSNLMLREPDADQLDGTRFMWIDLECVQCGVAPTRHQVTRNLVQLNGSLGTHIRDDDRCAFLEDLSRVFPWATSKATKQKIRRWTKKRLDKEKWS